MLISVHIPKTAGTAWRLYLEANAGPRALFDSVERRDATSPTRAARVHMEAGRHDAARACLELHGAALIHGHLAQNFLALYPGAGVVTFLREPRRRMAAEFLHLRTYARDETALFAGVHTGRIGFVEFAERRGALYARLLRSLPEETTLAFLTEAPGTAERACARALGWRGRLPRRNVAPPSIQAEAGDLLAHHGPHLDAVLAEDIAVYEDWRTRWETGEAEARIARVLARGPAYAGTPALAGLRRRLGALREGVGRAIGRDWR